MIFHTEHTIVALTLRDMFGLSVFDAADFRFDPSKLRVGPMTTKLVGLLVHDRNAPLLIQPAGLPLYTDTGSTLMRL